MPFSRAANFQANKSGLGFSRNAECDHIRGGLSMDCSFTICAAVRTEYGSR